MVACDKIPLDTPVTTFGDVWLALDLATDLLTECRKRHDKLIEYNLESK